MGLGRHRACDLGAQAFQLLLGDVAAHGLQGAGEHPGLPGQRQALGLLLLARPVHAELAQLLLDLTGALGIAGVVEELAQALGRTLGQALDLAQVEPVGVDDAFQRTEAAGQLFRAGGGDEGDVELVDEAGQGGAGGELGSHLALLLQLHAVLGVEQFGDHLAVVLVGEEVVDLVGHLGADVRQVGQHFRQGLLDARQRTQGAGQQLGGLLADVGDAQGVDEARQARPAAVGDGFEQLVAGHLGEAFQLDHLLVGQAVEVGRRLDQALVHQLLDDLVA